MFEPKGADPSGGTPLGMFEDLLDGAGMSAPAAPAAARTSTGMFYGVVHKNVGYRKLTGRDDEEEGYIL